MTMSKSTLFVLAGFLLVSVAFGGDTNGTGRSPLDGITERVSITPAEVCKSRGHGSACKGSARQLCSNVRCLSVDRKKIVSTGEASDNMWCYRDHVCLNGTCIPHPSTLEPTLDPKFVHC